MVLHISQIKKKGHVLKAKILASDLLISFLHFKGTFLDIGKLEKICTWKNITEKTTISVVF